MRDTLNALPFWWEDRIPFALATVIKTWGSAPRAAGSMMAVREDNRVTGSVSAGCVEGAVVEEALGVIAGNQSRILSFDVANESAWSVGLSCGGQIKVFVEKYFGFSEQKTEQEVGEALLRASKEGKPFILLTRLSETHGGHLLVWPDGSLAGDWGAAANAEARDIALNFYEKRESAEATILGESVFVQVSPPKSRIIIVGATHIGKHLIQLAAKLDFETIVIDPRKVFASDEIFTSQAGSVLADWPQNVLPGLNLDGDTYAVVLTHDPKIDDPALKILLSSPVAYVGALGSRRTHADRCRRLEKEGLEQSFIERIHAPIGLDIKARTPAEIALSIVAEIVKIKGETRLDKKI